MYKGIGFRFAPAWEGDGIFKMSEDGCQNMKPPCIA